MTKVNKYYISCFYFINGGNGYSGHTISQEGKVTEDTIVEWTSKLKEQFNYEDIVIISFQKLDS